MYFTADVAGSQTATPSHARKQPATFRAQPITVTARLWVRVSRRETTDLYLLFSYTIFHCVPNQLLWLLLPQACQYPWKGKHSESMEKCTYIWNATCKIAIYYKPALPSSLWILFCSLTQSKRQQSNCMTSSVRLVTIFASRQTYEHVDFHCVCSFSFFFCITV